MPGSIRLRPDTPRQDAGVRVHLADPLAAHPEALTGVSKHTTGPSRTPGPRSRRKGCQQTRTIPAIWPVAIHDRSPIPELQPDPETETAHAAERMTMHAADATPFSYLSAPHRRSRRSLLSQIGPFCAAH